MAARCKTNRSIFFKKRLVAVKITEVFMKKNWLVAVETTEVETTEKKELKCKNNLSVFRKKRPVAVKSAEAVLKKE